MTTQTRKALRKLDHAYAHLKPRMNPQGCFIRISDGNIKPHHIANGEALAGCLIGWLMCEVVKADTSHLYCRNCGMGLSDREQGLCCECAPRDER